MKPIVTIVIPNFNKGELVRHSLDSLLRQTLNNWEAIVVDDVSSDCSWSIIQEYANRDGRIIAIRNEENRGGNFSRNYGAKMAKGRYLIFLDSDDWLIDDCVEKRVEEFERGRNQEVDMIVFPMQSVCGEEKLRLWRWRGGDALLGFLRHTIPWSIMMPIWRTGAFFRIGGFDEIFPRMQDIELHTRALLSGLKVCSAQSEDPDCFYYVEESRMTMNHYKLAESFSKACVMYVEKIRCLIQSSDLCEREKRHLCNALQETSMAGISMVGTLYQRRLISRYERDSLYRKILSWKYVRWYVCLYAVLYKGWINKIRGFNYSYRKLIRCL